MKPTESQSVQKRIIEYAKQIGWVYVPREESDSRRDSGIFYKNRPYYNDLILEKLYEFNPWLPADFVPSEFFPRIEGNKDALSFLRGQSTAYDQKEKRERNIKVIDFTNPNNNIFEVTDEFSFSNSRYSNRQDIVFLINGIPVMSIECKNLTTSEGIDKALDQIRRYHRESPELLAIEQAYLASEGMRLEYGVTWNTVRRNIFTWKGDKVGDLENKIKTFFDIKHILNVIQKYMMFIEKDEKLTKIILREHQACAVEAVVARALCDDKTRGLIWHTQGSGKTFTMIKTAELLFKSDEADKPTVVMMLDRNELEDQMEKNLRSTGLQNVRRAETINDLVEILKTDYRGIVVTMIHKFRGLPANLNMRRNIFVLIDEAHRTTGGDLGTFVMAAMPNATFIGYTGTPIDKTQYGRGTFKTFGVADAKGYLHKYNISESIEDGTTLPLYYSLAPNEMLVPKEMLEREFLNLAQEHGVTDIEELNAVLERAVNTRNFLKGQGRIEKVGKFVAEHFKKYIEPMDYKAFLVAVDREACALYKKELDKYLPAEWSEVVYSGNNNDSELLKEFTHKEDKEKEIRRDFIKFGSNPKILIVTEKLLTGYDAPILYCMYLDKPMRDHVLLQTIARVNRPYENEEMKMVKPHGFVLDFVGIFDKLEKALSFDSDEVNAVVKDLSLLKERFAQKLTKDSQEYFDLLLGPFDDRLAGALIEYFRDEGKRKIFFKLYNEIEMLYEIISPDAFLRPYIDSYTTLSNMYQVIRNAYSKQPQVDREFQKKTSALVQEHIQSSPIKLGSELYKIDSEGIEIIKDKNQPDEIKIINLVKSIQRLADEKSNDPVLISVKERAESIMDAYARRQTTTQDALKQLIALAENEAKRNQEQEQEGISSIAWFIRDVLIAENIVDIHAVKDLESIINEYPEFRKSDKLTRDLRNGIYNRLESLGISIADQKKITDKIVETLMRTSS
ncbi:restriction endonuclease subunit R [candidate division WOR-1 bacterium RIFOXYB2_FULL_37_13]|uniref:Type I restriction enzyme endonuclease subunit n=1 Tax=candidate division WOR-1 bacterium RIFOXYB2_FULL_37_13 TaxID=1802579 RepID=A0A1F4SUJ7_UNCSA|nr:MAG: restriction endonuclease subunit R [candidate division WOR-1 bacterium RIFOXYB2_FULL_37_13]